METFLFSQETRKIIWNSKYFPTYSFISILQHKFRLTIIVNILQALKAL